MTLESLHIRPATRDDVDTIIEFNRAMALETESRRLDLATLRTGTLAILESPEYGFYVVAELPEGQRHKPVGQLMITYEWSDWRNGVVWWIQSVYVLPQFRRQGIYRGLYSCIQAMARADESVRAIRLYVDRRNISAQKLYESLGMNGDHYQVFEWVKD